MKLFKSIILFLAVAFTFMSAGAQNVSLNILTQNSGQVNQGGSVFVEVTLANTSSTVTVPLNKVRPQISVPTSIVSIPTTGHVLPSGWSIISNAGGVIRLCNGSDAIPPNTARTALIKVDGNVLGGPLTVSGNTTFANGTNCATSGGATTGDATGDNTSTSTIEVVAGPACSIAVSASAGSIACNGGTTTLTATATGASGAVEYSLNGGAYQPGNTFTVNAAGSPYTVTAREVATPSCNATSTAVTVTEPSAISASASAGSIACNGGTTTLTVTATGGTGSLEYSLNGGAFQSGNTFTVNAAGSPYVVTVRDANLCTSTTNSVTVSQPLAISASASAGSIACNGGTTTLTVTASGGTGSLEYSLNGGAFQPGNTFTVTAGSPYVVTVRDANLCTSTTNSVTVTEPSAIIASALAGSIACNGGTTTLTVNASGGTGTLEYSLNGGAFQSGNTFTVNAAGSPYVVTVRDANLCTSTTNSVTVSQPTLLTATASSTPVTTTGGSDGTATAIPVGGTSPYGYLWTPGGQTSITATGLTAGGYSVTVTDANGCTASASTTVGSPACAISVSASAGSIACNGGTTTLTATATGAAGAVEYSLNGGAYQPGNTFTVNAAGSPYTLTAREIANPSCSATSAAVTVSEPALLTILSASVTTPIAVPGGTGTITVSAAGGTGAVSYVVTSGTTVNATGAVTGVFTGLLAGSYTFTVTDANNCTAVSAAVVLADPSVVPLTATFVKKNLSVCGGSNDGSITVTPTGGTAPYSYSWTGLTGSNQTPFTAGNVATISGLNYGFYSVTVTDAAFNTFTISNINVQFAFAVFVTASGSASSSCSPTGSIILYGNAGVQPYTYSLDGITYQASNTFTGLAAGTYTGYIKDNAGCVSTKPNIIIGQAPALSAIPFARAASSCANDGVIEIYRTGGIPSFTYSIDGINYQLSNVFTGIAPGSYTAFVKDSKGCTASQSVVVAQGAAIVATAGKTNTSSCIADGTAQVNATGGVAPYTYSINGGSFQSSNTFTGLAAGNYTLSVKDAKNCTGSVSVVIGTNTIVVTAFAGSASSCSASNGSIQLFRTGGVGPFTYSINGNVYQSSNSFTGLVPGTYTGYVKDSKGCVGELTSIVVGPNCPVPPIAGGTLTKGIALNAPEMGNLKVQAYPNPSVSEFTIALEGFNSLERVSLTVTDQLGRIVHQANISAKLQYRFGGNLVAGVYNVQVIQGKVSKSLKVVKE